MTTTAVANCALSADRPADRALPATDPLLDRHRFIARVQQWLKRPAGASASALMYLRPDHYASIDERLGPVASEDLLCSLGEFVAGHLGRSPVVGRFGGNIFTVLFERPTLSELKFSAEELRAAIAEQIFEVGPYSTGMTVSVGMVELTELVPDEIEALSLVQAAARRAREFGGNRVELDTSLEYSEGDKAETQRWTDNIQQALDRDAFQLVYQPMASMSEEDYNNYDVLVRMQGEQGEELLPGQFMPQAESTGLMPAIDRWVIEQAFRAAAARSADDKKTRVFLRVSAASLHDPDFFEWLGLESLKHKLDPEGIVMQISENTAEGNLALARTLGETCQKFNYKLCMANAGVSLYGMSLLKQLPLSYLSIDWGLMRDQRESAEPELAEELIKAAKNQKIELIAARVESARELARLVNLGIDHVVGYHVHEPVDYMVEDVQQV